MNNSQGYSVLCYNPAHNDHSTVTIKESSRIDNVDGSIVDFLVSKRKRRNNQNDDDDDHIMYTTSPSQKRCASSSTRNSITISSYDTELRDEPVDYLSLEEDYKTTALVSIFRQVSPESSPMPKNNDNNEDEEDNSSYPEFPNLARARTVTDPTDEEYDELFFSSDPPYMMVDSSSRLTSPPLEELVLCHQDNDKWSTDYYTRYEEKESMEKARDNVNEGWLVSDTTSSGASSSK
jgi:hypothetical protein